MVEVARMHAIKSSGEYPKLCVLVFGDFNAGLKVIFVYEYES